MKKIIFISVVLFFTSHSYSEITGSAHDFSSSGWNSSGEICIACHTPHNADSSIQAPLWNHTMSTAIYTVYTSPTMDVTTEQPGAESKLCLSCHDGTIALDSFGGNSGSNMLTGDSNLTTDLSDDHPIGILYEHQTGVSSGCGKCHFANRDIVFFEKRIECATCHDPHNSYPANTHLLRVSINNSELCLICHNK